MKEAEKLSFDEKVPLPPLWQLLILKSSLQKSDFCKAGHTKQKVFRKKKGRAEIDSASVIEK